MRAQWVQCELCPKGCVIAPGHSGDCRIRVNLDGRLCAVTYGYPIAIHVDPMEKKPLFHFLPGTPILSLATVGCNLHCKNCQNWEISQRNPEDSEAVYLPPQDLPALARRAGCTSVAYTYTEPLAYYEYTLDSCRACREAGLRNVLVTAGYINPGPLRELCRFVDAANIDLKAMSDAFYRNVCAGTLAPVLNTLMLSKSLGVFVEVTNLVIPTLNDADEDLRSLARWVKENLGAETPLHFSRFFPHYQMRHLPPTPTATLLRAREIALAEGMKHVYVGNVPTGEGETTFCAHCGRAVIERSRYVILANRLKDGRCPYCGRETYGVWK